MFFGGCYTSWTSSCQDLPGSYQCKCISGVTGPKCNLDINECKSNNGLGPCNPLRTVKCTNFYPGYKCNCQEGKIANLRTLMTPSNTWITLMNTECLYSRFQPGFKGVHCDDDVNECTERTNPGPNKRGICYDLMTTRCQNTIGSFRCICKTGITGQTCYEDINECNMNAGMGPCVAANTVQCNNYFSGYNCLCKPGEPWRFRRPLQTIFEQRV